MPGFTFDNQTLLYIIIALFIVNFFVMRWYIQSSIETNQHSNNKKLIKRFTDHIGSTFDQYMGGNMKHGRQETRQETREDPRRRYNRHQRDVDSIDDPVDDIDDEYERHDRDPRMDTREHDRDNETDE